MFWKRLAILGTSSVMEVDLEPPQVPPMGLKPIAPAGGDPRTLHFNKASEFLTQLSLTSLAAVDFETLHSPPMTIQKSFKAGALNWSNKGLVIVMRKENNRFDINFADLWSKLRAMGVHDAKKILVENQIHWHWKWKLEGAVCSLSYWKYLNCSTDEGVKFHCTPKIA